jgi:uncharacterized protein
MDQRSGPRRRRRAGRAAAWLLAVALVGGCTPSDTADAPVADAPVADAPAGLDDASDPTTSSDPSDPSAPLSAPPAVPSLGTPADGLDGTAVLFERPGADDPAGAVRVDARVADDTPSRARGLMGVEELPEGAGMLFVYPDERTGAFWMKDTLVALDIAFIGADGTVRAVLTMEPCPADPCPVYDPEVAYLAALEVPAGWLATNGIEVGARATWSDPVPADVVEQ